MFSQKTTHFPIFAHETKNQITLQNGEATNLVTIWPSERWGKKGDYSPLARSLRVLLNELKIFPKSLSWSLSSCSGSQQKNVFGLQNKELSCKLKLRNRNPYRFTALFAPPSFRSPYIFPLSNFVESTTCRLSLDRNIIVQIISVRLKLPKMPYFSYVFLGLEGLRIVLNSHLYNKTKRYISCRWCLPGQWCHVCFHNPIVNCCGGFARRLS